MASFKWHPHAQTVTCLYLPDTRLLVFVLVFRSTGKGQPQQGQQCRRLNSGGRFVGWIKFLFYCVMSTCILTWELSPSLSLAAHNRWPIATCSLDERTGVPKRDIKSQVRASVRKALALHKRNAAEKWPTVGHLVTSVHSYTYIRSPSRVYSECAGRTGGRVSPGMLITVSLCHCYTC